MTMQLTRPVIVIACACTLVGAAPAPSVPAAIPLCPGLTIVTAVKQQSGDYESIKTIESIGESLRIDRDTRIVDMEFAEVRRVDAIDTHQQAVGAEDTPQFRQDAILEVR